jgi:NADPH:quinone reductase-like Zn-dependent oxidoreductase
MDKVMNHRIVVPERGGPEVLQFAEEPLPEPGAGEARVRVLAVGVSAYDSMMRSMWFPGFPKPPFTPGEDFVGIVDAIGGGVTALAPGDTVACGTFIGGGGGSYAEYVCRPVDELVPVPNGLDPAVAACLVVNYLTAHMMMHRVAKVQGGMRVLIQGAAGGTGSALLDLGRLAGLEMFGTASPHHHDFVSGFGATPIDYRSEDVPARIRKLTGDGVDVAFDAIGGFRQLVRSYRTLRKGGKLVWFGVANVSRYGIKVIPLSLMARTLLALLPDGKSAPLTPTPKKSNPADLAWYRDTLAELLDLTVAGKLSPVVADRIPLRDAARAQEMIGKGGYVGKLVLIPEHP